MIEARRVAEGASSRNGGMFGDLLKPSVGEFDGSIRSANGVEALRRSSRRARSTSRMFLAENGDSAAISRSSGRLTGALSEAQLAGVLRESDALRRLTGVEYEAVGKSDLAAELGTDAYVGARLYRHHASLHPAKYASELSRCVLAAGGVICESTAFLSCDATRRRLLDQDLGRRDPRARADRRDQRLLRTIGRSLATPAVPVTSYMIATDELPADLMSTLMPRGRVVTDTNRLLCYYRPSPDRKRILFGGRPAYTEIPPQESAKRLASYLHRLFPALANVPVSHSWFGMIAYTFDRLPHVGRSTASTTPAAIAARVSSWRHGSATRWRTASSAQPRERPPSRRSDIRRIRSISAVRGSCLLVQAWYQAADLWDRRA